MMWHPGLVALFYWFERVIIYYVGAINTVYFLLMVIGFFALREYRSQTTPQERFALASSPLVPEVSIIVPAFNEAVTIVESVKALLNLRYPNYNVIVVNDGSRDQTLHLLVEHFQLYKSACRTEATLSTKPVRAVYQSRSPIQLIVVDKENGGKSDALNAGLNVAHAPLVAAVDSDSLLEPDALLNVVEPFLKDPDRVLACGGIIRVVNGCQVDHGNVVRIATPRRGIALFQTIEYLRAFLGGRVAFSFFNSLLLISGAFGIFNRKAVVEAGGFLTTTVGEDMELVVRLHKQWRQKKSDYRIVFVPEPVCWTEVPENWETLHRQRNRWQRGTVETLSNHRDMIFRPQFGAPGLFALPYFLFFEMLGPAVELAGYGMTIAGICFGLISLEVATWFFVVSVLFGILLSMSAVVLEEFTMRRYPGVGDLGRLLAAAVLENLGYRQLLAAWRVQGVWDALRKKRGWGKMERHGFQRQIVRIRQQPSTPAGGR